MGFYKLNAHLNLERALLCRHRFSVRKWCLHVSGCPATPSGEGTSDFLRGRRIKDDDDRIHEQTKWDGQDCDQQLFSAHAS